MQLIYSVPQQTNFYYALCALTHQAHKPPQFLPIHESYGESSLLLYHLVYQAIGRAATTLQHFFGIHNYSA